MSETITGCGKGELIQILAVLFKEFLFTRSSLVWDMGVCCRSFMEWDESNGVCETISGSCPNSAGDKCDAIKQNESELE